MKISIALAVYNGEKFIIRQLDSIRKQTLQPDELIICDDASVDSSFKLIFDYIKKYNLSTWKLIKNENNLGYILNFKKALSLCSGDYILLCDQDDIWHDDKICRLCSIMDKNSQILALASSCSYIDEKGEAPQNEFKPFYKKAMHWKFGSLHRVSDKILYGNVAQGCVCIYRQSVIAEYLKCSHNCLLPHDWALNLLSHENNGLYYLNEKLIDYRIHSSNTTGIITEERSINLRADIINAYANNTHEILNMNVNNKERYLRLEEFSRLRVRMLREHNPGLIYSIVARYPDFSLGHFFLNLCKDVHVALCKKA